MKISRIRSVSALATIGAIILGGLGLGALSISTASAASCVKILNAVGKDYQTAQNIWRKQGFYVQIAKDGLGLNRLPFLDSNWKVIAQTPKAGTCVAKASGVRATVVKFTDL